MTTQELSELCVEWQKILRLEFWDVAIRFARAREFELKGSQGECSWTLSSALATIKILDPVDYPESPFKQDMEKTLVHELLHLHFAAVDKTVVGSLEETMLERTIDHIARALVSLKRQGREVSLCGND